MPLSVLSLQEVGKLDEDTAPGKPWVPDLSWRVFGATEIHKDGFNLNTSFHHPTKKD